MSTRTTILLILVLLCLTVSMILFYVRLLEGHKHIVITVNPSTIKGKTNKTPGLGEVSWVRLTVLVDNNPNPFNNELMSAWGLSILVETPYNIILFDAGPDPYILEHNSEVLNKDLRRVAFITISHEHGDHVGGLKYIARINNNIIVYVPAHMSSSTKKWIKSIGLYNVVNVYNTTQIAYGVAVIGEIYGPPYEQALAVNVKGLGLVIVVGCSHPGVDHIVEKAVRELGVKPYAVIGGFHLAGAPIYELDEIIHHLLSLGVEKIYPLHCSGDEIRHLLKSKYPEYYGEAYVGSTIEFRES